MSWRVSSWCWALALLASIASVACHSDGGVGPKDGRASAPVASGVTVVAGQFIGCALDARGAAYCWGAPEYGALGQPLVTRDTFLPVPVASSRTYVALTTDATVFVANQVTVCALTAAGAADCWGSSPGGLIGPPDRDCTDCVRTPRPVAPSLRFRRLSVGGGHICGITTDSTAVCWGNNKAGQLGDQSLTSRSTPTPVASALRFVEITAGETSTCALTADGTAYCWGDNSEAQLGDSTRTSRTVPTRVRFAGAFRSLDAGWLVTCGLSTEGAPYCWGATWGRKLGDGSPIRSHTSLTPERVAISVPLRTMDVGPATLCGIGEDDRTWCWGSGAYSVTGLLTEPRCVEAYCFPGPIDVPALQEVQVGVFHACGRARGGTVYCWGGQLAGLRRGADERRAGGDAACDAAAVIGSGGYGAVGATARRGSVSTAYRIHRASWTRGP